MLEGIGTAQAAGYAADAVRQGHERHARGGEIDEAIKEGGLAVNKSIRNEKVWARSSATRRLYELVATCVKTSPVSWRLALKVEEAVMIDIFAQLAGLATPRAEGVKRRLVVGHLDPQEDRAAIDNKGTTHHSG